MSYEATCSAPVNIACIKYWGKRDPLPLILPTNDSLSVTLDQDDLRSTTTIRATKEFKEDELWLNGKLEEKVNEGRTGRCIEEMRKLRKELEDKDSSLPPLSSYKIHIVSSNNFPTAAGLASSASGFAALTFTLYTLYGLSSTVSLSDLSRIARQGSGSACRSIFGGFVAWQMGSKEDGSDSLAVQVAEQSHWPEMEALICVVSDAKKETSSTLGMQSTVKTSDLLQHRIKYTVPKRMEEIKKSIQEKDFETFARITMQDSNSFHAVCADSYPPIFYMTDVSRAIVSCVNELNRCSGKLVAAYTYDAGPNAVIYATKDNMKQVAQLISHFFHPTAYIKGEDSLPEGFDEHKILGGALGNLSGVSSLIHTKVGGGPRVLDTEKEGLMDDEGAPKVRPGASTASKQAEN